MNKLAFAAAGFGLLVAVSGCAHNVVGANHSTRLGVFYGDLGIPADGTTITVQRLSRVNKLSILGHGNMVTVEQGAIVSHLEFCGTNNTVSIPENLIVRITELGRDNQLIRRPLTWVTPKPETTYVEPETDYLAPEPAAPATGWRAKLTPIEEEPTDEPSPGPVEEDTEEPPPGPEGPGPYEREFEK